MDKGAEEVYPGIPVNWIDVAKHESDGKHVKLASLTPRFHEASHRVYYDLLTRAVDAKGVRNVALTGAYGTGKSSVLEKLRTQRSSKVIELSLSTIVAPRREADDEDGDSASKDEKSQTNLIQKEIVKQLLYRLPAHKTPRSRFRRTSAPHTKRDWIVSAVIGVLAVGVALLLGLLQPPVELAVPEPWGRRLFAYILLVGAVTCVAWFIRRLIAGGPAVSASVGAGLTSVTLSSSDDTYFDKYLDEIVYFFQASKARIVVIEDIDRFEDVQVFDTLRALNVLLNSSSVLERIVFVYAIRDSIFEQIESVASPSSNEDLSRQALETANRTKFFDVIVPVVPFVSADNARDLMSRAMKSTEFSIDQSLIRISARYTADMRLIHNIRNEFEVYRNRLVVPDEHVYGINEDLVFAMIVFKNAHLADFEKIGHKDSTLDHLYTVWRQLVRSNLVVEVKRLAELRAALELDESADERARRWGERLLEHVETLRTSMQSANGGQTTVSFVGEIDETMIKQRTTWQAIAAGTPLRLHASTPRGHTLGIAFSAEDLGVLLGITIDPAEWSEPVRSEAESQIADCEERILFLRHHTWEELLLRPEFTLKLPQGVVTFDQLVNEKLVSPLAEELVRRGFITSHFALYASTYYGTHLGPDALEYVRRCIEPGEPDMLFHLDADSIQQLLIEQGADKDDKAEIFDDASILNVSIVNYLLQNRPHAADKLADRLTVWGEQESEFVATYCARGECPELLLAAMAPGWADAVQYAAVEAPLPPEKRVPTVDAVLGALPRATGYAADDKVRQRLEASYADLSSVMSPTSPRRAATVLGVFATCKATIKDVAALNDAAREAVVARRLYPVMEGNLRELVPGNSISLDALLEADERVYDHAIDNLDDYLLSFAEAAATKHTIDDALQFARIVTDAGKNGSAEGVRRVVSYANADCWVDSLSEVPSSAWSTILADDRTHATFRNIHLYSAERGSIDDVLSAFLTRHDVIKWEEDTAPLEERRAVSLAILSAAEVLPEVDARINLVVQMKPGSLPVEGIKPESGRFASRLIEEELIPDDAGTFEGELMADWTTREAAIVASKNFETFVSPETLPVSQIPHMLQSEKVMREVKETVVDDLTSYLAQATRQQAKDIADTLDAYQWSVPAPRIQALIDKGVSATQVLHFILRERDMPADTLRSLLRAMGKPYSRISDPGLRPALVPDDQEHSTLLARLKGVTVSTYDKDKKIEGKLRVNLHRTEK